MCRGCHEKEGMSLIIRSLNIAWLLLSALVTSKGGAQMDKIVAFGREGRGIESPHRRSTQSGALHWPPPHSWKMYTAILIIRNKRKKDKESQGKWWGRFINGPVLEFVCSSELRAVTETDTSNQTSQVTSTSVPETKWAISESFTQVC